MAFEWQYPRMEAGELYQLHFQPSKTVQSSGEPVGSGTGGIIMASGVPSGAKDGNAPDRQNLGGQAREVYPIGDWLVESIRQPYGLEILLRRIKNRAGNPLELSIVEGTAAVNIRLLRKPIEERSCQNVTKLFIYGESIKVFSGDPAPEKARKAAVPEPEKARKAAAPEPEEARKAAAPEPEKRGTGRGRPSPKPDRENTAMALELQEARNQAQAAMVRLEASEQINAQLKEQIQDMQARLEAERKRNVDLQTNADAHLPELLSALEREKERLSGDLRERLEEGEAAYAALKELDARINEARCQAEEAEALLSEKRTEAERAEALLSEKRVEAERAEALLSGKRVEAEKAEAALSEKRKELERLQSLEKLRTLDCGQVEKELAGLREQLEADGWSASLLAEEPFFDGPEMEDLMVEARRQLERIETRIAEAVRLREKIDGMIQDAALRGNGVISLEKEFG